jgi:hypothetical protein
MDDILKRVVIGSIIFGAAEATYLRMKGGKEFRKPDIVQLNDNAEGNKFGVSDPKESNQTFILLVSDIEALY